MSFKVVPLLKYQRWHQDIKPQNILVKSRNDASIYGCHFLIADLGLTHFKKVVHPEQDTSDKDAGGTYAYGWSTHFFNVLACLPNVLTTSHNRCTRNTPTQRD